MKKAIFLDIDGTIFRSSLVIEHYILLLKKSRNFLPDPRVKKQHDLWCDRKLCYEEYLLTLVADYTKLLKTIDLNTIKATAETVVKKEKDRLYNYTKDIIENAKKDNTLVFLISGSPDFLVEEFSRHLGVEGYGSQYIFENNKFTGTVVPLWDSMSKEAKLLELQKKYNVDLNQSYAYGDTTGDLSLFRMVGYPVLVNPNRKLLDAMKKYNKKYSILIERKDVSYLIRDVDTLEIF